MYMIDLMIGLHSLSEMKTDTICRGVIFKVQRYNMLTSYAFYAYYHWMVMAERTCDFNGMATVTTTDPSRDGCTFPESGGSNDNITDGTSLSPSPYNCFAKTC